jgi:hypothetical protein
MRVRSIPSVLRTLAIFIASIQAGSTGLASMAEARDLSQAPPKPVLQSDVLQTQTIGAEEVAGQRLLFAPVGVSAPMQGGSEIQALETSTALAPARRPTSRDSRSTQAACEERLFRQYHGGRRTVVVVSSVALSARQAKAPRRIRAP